MAELNSPGVTVVIPTYNYGRFLTHAIDSALTQTYSDVEVLVIDDGSTDDTADLAQSYGDRIKYVYQKNAGLSAARNAGIKRASNPLIVFLDSDDVLLPNMVERSVEKLGTLPDSFGVVACGCEAIDELGHVLTRRPPSSQVDLEITSSDLVLMNRFSPSVLVKRDTFDLAGFFDLDLKSSEDRDMWIRIGKFRRILLLPDQLVLKRVHGDNMSSNAERQSLNMRKVLRRAFCEDIVPWWNFFFWHKVAAIYLFQSAQMYNDNLKAFIAFRKLTFSLILWPSKIILKGVRFPAFFRFRLLAKVILRLP